MSGWSKLADQFHFQDRFKGKYYRFQSARLNKVNFSSSLEIGMDEIGLYLVPMILFRLFHKPIFFRGMKLRPNPSKDFYSKVID